MASAVDIVNLALSHLGDSAKVSSIAPPDASIQAHHASRFYPIALRFALARHAWQFATERKALAEITVNPDLYGRWAHAYALPPGCLRVIGLVSPLGLDVLQGQLTFTIETGPAGQRILLTDMPPDATILKYVGFTEDTGRFPPAFVLYLSYELAALLAGPVRKNERAADAMRVKAREFLIAAAGQDSNDQNADADKRRKYTPAHILARGVNAPFLEDAWVDRS